METVSGPGRDETRHSNCPAQEKDLARENAELAAELELAHRANDEFLATLSHELRTPLNVICGYAELLVSDFKTMEVDEVQLALEAIERNARTQTEIVNSLLDLSSLLTGRTIFKPEAFDLRALLNEEFVRARATAEVKGVIIETHFGETAFEWIGDAPKLHQIIRSLLENAVKFTPRGGRVSLEIAIRPEVCEIIVRDTGCGIAPEFLPFVFDRFRQEEVGVAKKFGGLGLGLSIAKSLAEMHGGTLQVESAGRGRGATFKLSLPRRHPRHEASPPSEASGALDGLKVLLIEDCEDHRSLLERVLKKNGASVRATCSAGEARATLSEERPDVIVSDVEMPGETGDEFIRWLRQQPEAKLRAIPALALTAHARDGDRERLLASGFQIHLPKPSLQREVLDAILWLAPSRVHA